MLRKITREAKSILMSQKTCERYAGLPADAPVPSTSGMPRGIFDFWEWWAGSAVLTTRMSRSSYKKGQVKCGPPISWEFGWDLRNATHRKQLKDLHRNHTPQLMWFATTCGPWSNSNTNMDPVELAKIRAVEMVTIELLMLMNIVLIIIITRFLPLYLPFCNFFYFTFFGEFCYLRFFAFDWWMLHVYLTFRYTEHHTWHAAANAASQFNCMHAPMGEFGCTTTFSPLFSQINDEHTHTLYTWSQEFWVSWALWVSLTKSKPNKALAVGADSFVNTVGFWRGWTSNRKNAVILYSLILTNCVQCTAWKNNFCFRYFLIEYRLQAEQNCCEGSEI